MINTLVVGILNGFDPVGCLFMVRDDLCSRQLIQTALAVLDQIQAFIHKGIDGLDQLLHRRIFFRF